MAAPPPAPMALIRTCSEGGIPVFRGTDVNVTQKAALNFDGLAPGPDRLWFGAMAFEIEGTKWTVDSFINYGAEGQTYLVTRQSTGHKFVAKFYKENEPREIGILQKMPRQLVVHPNFLSYEMIVLDVSSHFSPAHHIIFMEHIPNGEMFELLASQEPSVAGRPVSEGTSRRFLHDVINGMAECYKFGVTHRDLKPENLLINEEGRIVIIDLGHAKREALPPLARTSTVNVYGTPAFNAPEVTLGGKYDCEAADVWSVGVIAFMLNGKLPAFAQGGGVALWDDVTGTGNERFWRKISSSGYYPPFPDELQQFINMLWRKDPGQRPSFSHLEQAINGDEETIAQFPGLKWLSQPVNDVPTFIDELRRSCPTKTFKAASVAPPDIEGSGAVGEAGEGLEETPQAGPETPQVDPETPQAAGAPEAGHVKR